MRPPEYKYDLFISYAAPDSAWVEGYLLDALRQAQIRYHSAATFALGAPLLEAFERVVEQSHRVLLVLTPAYLAQNTENFVGLLAQHYGLEAGVWPVIPLLLADVQLPSRLAMLVPLDARQPANWDAVLARLCQTLQAAPLIHVPKPLCPYPGMTPFGERESEFFFGRTAEIEQLLHKLRYHPFVTVIGPSGSGKSSLIFAGLIPALRQSTLFGLGGWLVRTMRPGAQPATALYQTLDITDFSEFALPITLATEPGTTKLLLIIDQFEELFTQASTERGVFLQNIQALIALAGCYVVITVRADFYADLMTSNLWRAIEPHRLDVVPLAEEGLREAIVRPAERRQVYIESALVERLVANAAGEPGVLPFVQEVLVLLWEKIERCYLPLRAYEALVLPYKALSGEERTGLQVAMAQKADAFLAELSVVQRTIAQRVFLQLVQFGEGRPNTRRQQTRRALQISNEDSLEFAVTVQKLTQNRLLTQSGDEQGEQQIDISHEAMLTGWPTLRNWINDWRNAELRRRRLEDQASEWVCLGKGEAGLLLKEALQEAEKWLKDAQATRLGITPHLQALIQASRLANNPGWHRLGTAGLLLSVGTLLVLFGCFYYFLWFFSGLQGLRATAQLVVFALGITLLSAFLLSRKSNPHLLQRSSHLVGKRPWLQACISGATVASLVLWLLLGRRISAIEQACYQLGYTPDTVKLNVAVLANQVDGQGAAIFNLKLRQISGDVINAQVVTPAQAEQCQHSLHYQISLDVLPQTEIMYKADIRQFHPMQTLPALLLIRQTEHCGAFVSLAYRFVNQYAREQSAPLDREVDLPSPPTCAALLANENGYQLLQEGHFIEAEREFQRLLRDHPDYAVAHANLGITYYEQAGKYDAAVGALQRAVELAQQRYAPFLIHLAIACFRARDYSCAEQADYRVITLDSSTERDILSAYYNVSSVYLATEKYEQAQQALQQMAKILADATAIETAFRQRARHALYKNQGVLAYKRGELTQAQAYFTTATTFGKQFHKEILFYQALIAEVASETNDQQACAYWQQYQKEPDTLFDENIRRAEAQRHIEQLHCTQA